MSQGALALAQGPGLLSHISLDQESSRKGTLNSSSISLCTFLLHVISQIAFSPSFQVTILDQLSHQGGFLTSSILPPTSHPA